MKSRRQVANELIADLAHARRKMKSGLDIQLVTPECFNRGARPDSAWIPAKSMRE